MFRLTNRACFVAASVASVLAWSAASAQPTPPTRVVSYADLNLSTDAGATALLKRLKGAAWQVCRDVALGRHDLDAAEELRACEDEAVTNAARKVGSERLAGAVAVKVTRSVHKARLATAN